MGYTMPIHAELRTSDEKAAAQANDNLMPGCREVHHSKRDGSNHRKPRSAENIAFHSDIITQDRQSVGWPRCFPSPPASASICGALLCLALPCRSNAQRRESTNRRGGRREQTPPSMGPPVQKSSPPPCLVRSVRLCVLQCWLLGGNKKGMERRERRSEQGARREGRAEAAWRGKKRLKAGARSKGCRGACHARHVVRRPWPRRRGGTIVTCRVKV